MLVGNGRDGFDGLEFGELTQAHCGFVLGGGIFVPHKPVENDQGNATN